MDISSKLKLQIKRFKHTLSLIFNQLNILFVSSNCKILDKMIRPFAVIILMS